MARSADWPSEYLPRGKWCSWTSESAAGHELHFQVNYLAHFLLTRMVLPRLRETAAAHREARVIQVSSTAQSPIDFDDAMLERDGAHNRGYGQSKLAHEPPRGRAAGIVRRSTRPRAAWLAGNGGATLLRITASGSCGSSPSARQRLRREVAACR